AEDGRIGLVGGRARQPAPARRPRLLPPLQRAYAARVSRVAHDARGPLRRRARARDEPVREPHRARRPGLSGDAHPRRGQDVRARVRHPRRPGRDRFVRGVAAVRVVSCSTGHYGVPREVWWPGGPIGASLYEISDIELVTLDVETDDGVSGFGFTYTVGHRGSADPAPAEDAVVPELLGRDPRDAEAIWHELHAKLHFVGAGGVTAVAIAAADIALWDALAIAAELPLHRLLGVHRTSIPAYASAVNLALSTA